MDTTTAQYTAYEQWKTIPLSEPPVLSIIIPAYNESERIIPTIGAVAYAVSSMGMPWELIISDDGSRDDTVAQVEQLALVNARVIKAPQNGGKGSAVRRGMLAARGELWVFTDADNSSPIEELPKLLAPLRNGADMTLGSRGMAESSVVGKSGLRLLMSSVLNKLVKLGLGLPYADTQCGFKAFKAVTAKKLFKAQTIDGFSFDLELLYLVQRFKLTAVEVPISWYDAPGSKVQSLKHSLQFLKDMLRIRKQDLLGQYQLSAADVDVKLA
ncbi:MAG: glycosyltransferase family 2 protein [Anaerolineae bacterium]|nr:glycosyltransferase family 2 protein [Anaerolineae bacterium]